jgi:ribosomal protein L37AE/L43A
MSSYDRYITDYDSVGGNGYCEECDTKLVESDEEECWICPKCGAKYSFETGCRI